MRAGLFALLLFATAAFAQRVTESESHIASAFTSGADPGVLAGNVRVGPTLRGLLGAAADSRKVYDALFERVSGKMLQIRVLSAAEASRHATLVGASPDPLIVLEAGDLALLMQYAPRDKNVNFVEQLSGPKPSAKSAPPKPQAVTPQLAPAPPMPVIEPVVLEKPIPIVAPPRPQPQAECVIKPVMTDDELRACGAR